MNDKVFARESNQQNCKAHFKREAKQGFTLAEVLITLAIIGVVAAMTIPAVIVNTNQAEFKTGLRKAVSVLNSAITLNKALTGESPYDNEDLFNYLQQHMAIMSKTNKLTSCVNGGGGAPNVSECSGSLTNMAFYTTDGMRFEVIESDAENLSFRLYESDEHRAKLSAMWDGEQSLLGKCGSMGLAHNPDGTTQPPCIIMVDVNGDRKPSSGSIMDGGTRISMNKYADPNGRLLTDVFSIMITDQGAIPYGVVAQKAMYQAQK